MNKSFRYLVLSALMLTFLNGASGQKQKLTLEDVVLKRRTAFTPTTLSNLQWLKGKDSYSYRKDNTLMVGSVGKQAKAMISLKTFNQAMSKSGFDTLSYFPYITWESDKAFTFTSNNHLFRYSGKAVSKLNSYEKDMANRDVHPITHKAAGTIDSDLFIVEQGNPTPISNDGGNGIVYGQSVHRNEFGITKGTFWSPKGNYLAFYRMDESMVTEYPIMELSSQPSTVNMIRYPMAGAASHHVTVGVYDVENKNTLYLQTGLPKEQYLTNVTWGPNEQYVYIAVVNRGQDHMWLNQYDRATGQFVKTLFEETSKTYVEPEHGLLFVPGNDNQFVWQSERDGYNHLYLYNIDGKLVRQLTKGDWVVTEVNGFSSSGNQLFFTATSTGPLERQIHSVVLKDGKITNITTRPGTHWALISDKGTYIIDNYSSIEIPRTISIRDTKKGVLKQTLHNAGDPMDAYDLGETRLLTVKNDDGLPLHCRMILPVGFDESKKYPVIVYVYGGPHVQLIRNSYLASADTWFHYLAQEGYIVFTMDSRGSSNRGHVFESTVHRQLGTNEMADQLKGVEYLKSLPYVDADRMGVTGWSFGGFMTTTLMTRAPGTFKVGVAGGPVIDWGLYEVMYTERYMDTPKENPEGYELANLMNHVDKLEGKLLMIHGTSDNVVVWQHSLKYLEKAVSTGTQLEYFVYPEHLHNVRGKDRVHLIRKMTEYLVDHL